MLLEHNANPTIEVEISTMHDDYTKPAIQAAYENGHSEIVKLLEKYYEKK